MPAKKRKTKKSKSSLGDANLEPLDNALTAAEAELRKMLPKHTPEEIAEYFVQHIQSHLAVELSNIATHGHRGDDPDDDPDSEEV